MATRGPEGRAPLPSDVTSPLDDNKPRPGGDPTLTDDYLDFEGNVRPRSTHGAPSASEGKAVEGRDRRRDAKRGQGEQAPPGTRKFNNFNYWRKKLPDVTREIQYILTPKSTRRPLRRDVNDNEGDASFRVLPEAEADPREPGLRERRNLRRLAVAKPSKHSPREEDEELEEEEEEEEERRRGKGKGKGRRPPTPRRHNAAAGLVPFAFVECAGESSTDDFEYIPGAGRDGPRAGHEAPDRRGDRGADDDEEEDEEVAELEDDHFRALAVDRPKSGSFSDYSRLVSARPFATAPRSPTTGNFLTVDDAASEFFRRSSAPVGTLTDILGKFHATRKVPGGPGSSPSSAAVLGFLSRLSSDGDFNHNSEEDIYSSRGSKTLPGLIPFEYDTDDSEAENSYDIMGNIQGAEGRRAAKGEKQKAKAKGKLSKGKSPSKGKLQGSRDALDDVTTPSSVMAATVGMSPSPRRQQGSSPVTPGTPLATTPLAPSPQHPKAPASIVTDSWKQARKIEDEGLGGGTGQAPVAFADSSSSSESVFTEARSGGPGRNGSLHDALTPVGDDAGGGAATPVFTETLDLPIDAIMGGYYSSSETSSVCSRPPTVAGQGGSSSSLLDEKKTAHDDVGETIPKREREKTERGRASSPTKKTARREGEAGGEGEGVEVSVPGARPPHQRGQVDTTTQPTLSQSLQDRQRAGSASHPPSGSSSNLRSDTSPSGSRPSTRTPSKRREKASVSDSVSDSVTAADEDVILSPAGVDLEFSVSSVYEECDEGGEHARPHPLRYVPSASASYEESLGSFICLDLESEGGPTQQSAGYTLEDEPGGEDADKTRSFSADDLDDLELEEGECYEYSGEEYDDDMPQASGAGRGSGGSGGSSAFRVSRHRKVELQPARTLPARPPANNNNNNNNSNSSSGKSRTYSESSGNGTEQRGRRSGSSGDVGVVDSNVLRKVASLTLDRATIEKRVVKPKFVPEKLDFKIYEKFEGQMLINWFVSAFSEGHYLRHVITPQDLKILATQFCTHLLAAGVIRQIEDTGAPLELLFRPDLMYYWSHTEASPAQILTPGKLSPSAWPPPNFAELISSSRPGAKYTEAGPLPDVSPHSDTNGIVIEAEVDDNKNGEGEEFQQVVMGLKREHKDSLDRVERDQEVNLFNLRGEQAEKLCQYEQKIRELEVELEKLKTVSAIQELTAKTCADFDSPSIPLSPKKASASPGSGPPSLPPPPPSPTPIRTRCGIPSQCLHWPICPPAPPTTTSRNARDGSTSSTSTSTSTSWHVGTTTSTTASPRDGTSSPSPSSNAHDGGTPTPSSDAGNDGTPSPSSHARNGRTSTTPSHARDGGSSTSTSTSWYGPASPSCPPWHERASSTSLRWAGPFPRPPARWLECSTPGCIKAKVSSVIPSFLVCLLLPVCACVSLATPVPCSPLVSAPGSSVSLLLTSQAVPVLRKAPVNPKMAMKPLYWTRIQLKTPKPPKPEPEPEEEDEVDSKNETKEEKEENKEKSDKKEGSLKRAKKRKADIPLWDEIEEEEFDELEFVDLFARQVTQPKKKEKKEAKPAKVKVNKVLDSKRSQNVGIFITSQHLDIADVENAVYNFDTSVLDLEVLQQIYEVRGSEGEINMIKAANEAMADVPLDKPEQFLLDLSKINEFAERTACFTFQATFNEELGVIHGRIHMLQSTIDVLVASESIKRIFGLILALGNYMNGGNRTRGQADGFGLEILPKIKDVKSKETGFTLLHFVVTKYIEKYEGEDAGTDKVQLPIPDPYVVERVSNLKFEDLESDLKDIEKNLKVCENRAEKVIAKSDEEHLQPFKDRMTEFFVKAKSEVESESESLKECKSQFEMVMKYFQFSGKGPEVTPYDFFSVWSPFCNDFMNIWQKEQQKIVKQRMKAAEEKVKKMTEEKKDVAKKTKEVGGLKSKLKDKLKT
ncbi:uncharacterized protein LOC125042112 [Penaeus chinensis]|uniref:uncharacterized protein LOC125042112 n=1 Tax=Penaeus chinensis TaxID=139456 RepID=UPI001FB7A2EA|nr:uncharacterized protein LOC125042112 [Penaeus chinensis]